MRERCDKLFNPYLGKSYTINEIKKAIYDYRSDVIAKECENKYRQAAAAIANSKIVGWFQGRGECGPRALGNRSLLADPRNPQMKDIINSRVKFRESFRPFAPSVLYEYQQEYFDLDIPSPYMLIVADVLEEKRGVIPAVVHVDGTARLQTVLKEMNPVYYQLIKAFYHLTGVPVVLNTSFNINKEPIVETPEDALQCFLNSDFDELYLEDIYIVKK